MNPTDLQKLSIPQLSELLIEIIRIFIAREKISTLLKIIRHEVPADKLRYIYLKNETAPRPRKSASSHSSPTVQGWIDLIQTRINQHVAFLTARGTSKGIVKHNLYVENLPFAFLHTNFGHPEL